MEINIPKNIFWPGMAMASFLASLYFGLLPGWQTLVLWAAFGALGFVFIIKSFPNTWNYFFWYALSYILIYIGIVLSGIISPSLELGKWFVFFLGLVILAAGYGVIAYLIYHMKKVRDRLCGVTDTGEIDLNLVRQGYVPMGLWAAASILFYFFALLGAYAWLIWAHEGGTAYLFYALFEVMAFYELLYALWVPQTKLDWTTYYRDFPTTYDSIVDLSARNLYSRLPISRVRKSSGERSAEKERKRAGGPAGHDGERCPRCNGRTVKRTRSCPKCGFERRFTYCLKEEAYIILCPKCDHHNRYGSAKCERCGNRLSRLIPCPRCGYKGEISRWKT